MIHPRSCSYLFARPIAFIATFDY